MSANLSKLYYKDYFSNMSFDDGDGDKRKIKEKNRILEGSVWVPMPKNESAKAEHCIRTVIQYPGLVTGVGINHEARIEGEFKLGVHFDYSYGMPVIYGSSVKGLMRSAFPQSISEIQRESVVTKRNKKEKIRNAKIKLIKDYLKELSIDSGTIDIDSLRDEIFEGNVKNEDGIVKPISIYNRDIFFDAVIIAANRKNRILESDSITPHIKKDIPYEKSILKNPVPITFLKIASGVTMEFRFDLKDGIINSLKKKELFEKILLDFGIGAKTNVGYGQFNKV